MPLPLPCAPAVPTFMVRLQWRCAPYSQPELPRPHTPGSSQAASSSLGLPAHCAPTRSACVRVAPAWPRRSAAPSNAARWASRHGCSARGCRPSCVPTRQSTVRSWSTTVSAPVHSRRRHQTRQLVKRSLAAVATLRLCARCGGYTSSELAAGLASAPQPPRRCDTVVCCVAHRWSLGGRCVFSTSSSLHELRILG